MAFVKSFMKANKLVFAICHGPQILISARELEGRDVTGYKSIRVDLENAGAKFHDEASSCMWKSVSDKQNTKRFA